MKRAKPTPAECPNCGRPNVETVRHSSTHLRNRCEWCGWSDGAEQGRWGFGLEHSTEYVPYAHHPRDCIGEHCPLHRRSDHALRSWRQVWRARRMWRECEHEVLHPDPDEPRKLNTHVCDGCCYIAIADAEGKVEVPRSSSPGTWGEPGDVEGY